VIQKEIENRNDIRLALKSISRMPSPLQAYLLCSHDIHYMAQLTSNTDGRVNKLVMFFAKASLPSRQETARG
jgi:hypothetical protein